MYPRHAYHGLFIGRFQPFHLGHLEVIKRIRYHGRVIVAVGSAQDSYEFENPFTASERMEMILAALEEYHLDRVIVVPVADTDQNAEWVGHLRNLLPPFECVYTGNPLVEELFLADGRYKLKQLERTDYSGTKVRELLASHDEWHGMVPQSVKAILEDLNAEARLERLLTI
jgi:nicotinamide-nucleotide adenylyltransferase